MGGRIYNYITCVENLPRESKYCAGGYTKRSERDEVEHRQRQASGLMRNIMWRGEELPKPSLGRASIWNRFRVRPGTSARETEPTSPYRTRNSGPPMHASCDNHVTDLSNPSAKLKYEVR